MLGLNGVTEAFVRAAISPTQQYRLNLLLIVFSGVHVVACSLLLRSSLASVGLVYANCLGMALRLCYSAWFIRGYLPEFAWTGVLPPIPTLAVLAGARLFLSWVAPGLCGPQLVRDLSVSLPASSCWVLVAAAGAVLVVVAVLEVMLDRVWLLELRELWRGRASLKKE